MHDPVRQQWCESTITLRIACACQSSLGTFGTAELRYFRSIAFGRFEQALADVGERRWRRTSTFQAFSCQVAEGGSNAHREGSASVSSSGYIMLALFIFSAWSGSLVCGQRGKDAGTRSADLGHLTWVCATSAGNAHLSSQFRWNHVHWLTSMG